MGLFDSFYFRFLPAEYNHPETGEPIEFQTKSMECVLGVYDVDLEGNVYYRKYLGNNEYKLIRDETLSAGFSAVSVIYDDTLDLNIEVHGLISKGKLLILVSNDRILFLHPDLRKAIHIFLASHDPDTAERHKQTDPVSPGRFSRPHNRKNRTFSNSSNIKERGFFQCAVRFGERIRLWLVQIFSRLFRH